LQSNHRSTEKLQMGYITSAWIAVPLGSAVISNCPDHCEWRKMMGARVPGTNAKIYH